MTRDELNALTAGDRVVVTDGYREWANTVVRVTAKLVYTDGRTYSRETGVAKQYSVRPNRIVRAESRVYTSAELLALGLL